jgi:ABC-type multidrug transport system ATPase subunit
LIKIISGGEEASNGDIFMDNRSLITDKKFLYKNIGLCSQEDILFEELTVEEHLKLMTEMKGAQINYHEIEDLLIKLELSNKKNDLSKNLSGGQKRKLCIAIAMIGNSKLILLDEPTSGMDIFAKRSLWNFLKNYKTNKIIILTTHSLDEADYLGDRIGIMSEGKLICGGTSTFLKNRYTCGFNINFLFTKGRLNDEIAQQFLTEMKEAEPFLKLRVIGKEMMQINFPEIGNNINRVFSTIDRLQQKYSIVSYTLATTSLEDVFLKLNDQNVFNEEQLHDSINNREQNKSINEGDKMESNLLVDDRFEQFSNNQIKPSSIFHQIFANLVRHFISLYKNFGPYLIQVLFSSFFFFIYVSVFPTQSSKTSIQYSSLEKLLSKGKIYYQTPTMGINYFEKTNYKLNLKQLNLDGDVSDYNKKIFDKFPNHDIKGDFYVESKEEQINAYYFYNPSSVDFKLALNSLVLSSYLKNEYGINTKLTVIY